MCLSQVGEVRELDGVGSALCCVDGVTRRVSTAVLSLEGTPVAEGDWLLIHTGMAVEVLEVERARMLGALHREIRSAGSAPDAKGPR